MVSIALGVGELFATSTFARFLGMPDKKGILRLYGLREIGAGVALLASRPSERGKWLWTRVAGDAVDLATLAWAFARAPSARGNLAFAASSVLGVTALDIGCAVAS
jgi:hypothetical protein